MKVIKPQRLGVLSRTFEHGGRCHFTISVLAFFPFEAPHALQPEVAMWKFVAGELGKDAALDDAMPKPHGEVIINGRAYPVRPPQPACTVRVSIGTVDKTLRIVGDRHWNHDDVPSSPAPFSEMPLTWEHAFGGEGYAQNPLGRGAALVPGPRGSVRPLPNIEDPKHTVKSPRDRPAPAGFAPYDFMWPQRFSKAGTYDAEWLKTRFPGLADDVDVTMFNVAPPDQWLTGFFRGDETFLLEHMHPSRPTIEGRLPGVRARAFVQQQVRDGQRFHEISTRLDTVRLFPHAEKGVLVFRGVTEVAEDDAADVLQLVVACEDMGDSRPVEHYQSVLQARMDKKMGALLALRDKDLMPSPRPEDATAREDRDPLSDAAKPPGVMQQNLRRRAERHREALIAEMKAAGVDPKNVPPLPPEPVPPDPDELSATVEQAETYAENARASAEGQKAGIEMYMRQLCALTGQSYDKMVQENAGALGGPPRYSARAEIEKLRFTAESARRAGLPAAALDAMLADPTLESRLADTERQIVAAYRRMAHHFPAAARLTGDVAARLRKEVQRALAARESLAGRDLTGADLSELDLRGADLRGALLECATLVRSDLAGADLSEAVLVRADLSNARLQGTRLVSANLGSAVLREAWMSGGADLTGATLVKADLTGADASGANLSRADLLETAFGGCNLSGALAPKIMLYKADLRSMDLSGADLRDATLVEVQVSGANFTRANLTGAVFVTAVGEGAIFRNAELENLRVVKDSSFERADFQGAQLTGANLRGTTLAGSDFSRARLCSADLSNCALSRANFSRADAREARFLRADLTDAVMTSANLMGADLQKTLVGGTDCSHANLYGADMARARGNDRTTLDGANVTRLRVIPKAHKQAGLHEP